VQRNRNRVYDCLGLGICPLDYLGVVSTYPKLNQKVDLVDFKIQGGGPVPTALVAIARLGGKTALVGKIGNDHEGRLIKEGLESEGVDTDHLLVDRRGRSLQAFVWVDRQSGKRTVVLNNTESSEIKPEQIKASLFKKARFVLLDGRDLEANLRVSGLAKRYDCGIVIDVGSYRPEVKPLLPFTDYLVIGEEFSLEFTGIGKVERALVELYRRYKPRAVVITLGERGAVGTTDGSIFKQSGFKVQVVDTTGAGDVFHGAFVYALTRQWEVAKAVEFACACAAMKCTALGGRTGIPTYRKALKFLRSRKTNFRY
jgi:sulfofructose kinase